MVVRRFDIFIVSLDPVVGSELRKTRPCLVVSPDEMNRNIATVIIAPMTSRGQKYPTRVSCSVRRKRGQIVLDRIRTVDKSRLVRKLGKLVLVTQTKVLSVLAEMFAPESSTKSTEE